MSYLTVVFDPLTVGLFHLLSSARGLGVIQLRHAVVLLSYD